MGLGVMYVAIPRNLRIGVIVLITLHSTGACCIVRTVLNWTTESDDSTCKPSSQPFISSMLTTSTRGERTKLDVEMASYFMASNA